MTSAARLLEPQEDLGRQIREVLDREPVQNCFLHSRLAPLFPTSYNSGESPIGSGQSIKNLVGGDVYVYEEDGQVTDVCYVGANLVPTPASDRAINAFAARLRRTGRYASSILGPRPAVLSLWDLLEEAWGPARAVRANQPLLAIDHLPKVSGDPSVREVELVEIPALLPASIAMFTEELGISPIGSDGGALYRTKLTELVLAGFVFARIENGEVIFKCEIGALSPDACQIQGVWVKPDRRGEGIGTHGLARVVEIALGMAPVVCLYVNDFNLAARRSYAKIGFREVGAFASVLF